MIGLVLGHRGPCVQGVSGSVPYVDTRRLRRIANTRHRVFSPPAPKVAAMALFARVMHDAFGNAKADWQQVIVLISLLSMFLGAVAAIGQTNIKRLMAYSSIAHMGIRPDGSCCRDRVWC
jgi:NADH-quinone oxidoreductase subunit N